MILSGKASNHTADHWQCLQIFASILFFWYEDYISLCWSHFRLDFKTSKCFQRKQMAPTINFQFFYCLKIRSSHKNLNSSLLYPNYIFIKKGENPNTGSKDIVQQESVTEFSAFLLL